ncbi:hypothetical protein [Pseudomonas putida]|uniref:hypothetical protein n=1 Tax=Pseudomonas putida TaxID=303 RepID=UPI0015FF5906|nr:hypothetical protein [Pseudomonas putida]
MGEQRHGGKSFGRQWVDSARKSLLQNNYKYAFAYNFSDTVAPAAQQQQPLLPAQIPQPMRQARQNQENHNKFN